MLKRLLVLTVMLACFTTFLTIQQTSKYRIRYNQDVPELRDAQVFHVEQRVTDHAPIQENFRRMSSDSKDIILSNSIENNYGTILIEEYQQQLFKSRPFVGKLPLKTSNQYLLPILFYNMGPNNVLRLFKESIPIARALNRTLVVPPFHHHPRMLIRNEGNASDGQATINIDIFDQTYKSVVESDPQSVVDMQSLRYYVPAASMKEFSTFCNKQLDKVVSCGVLSPKRLSSLRHFVAFNDITCLGNLSIGSLHDVTEDNSLKLNLRNLQSNTMRSRCIGLAIGARCLGSRPAWLEQWSNVFPFVRHPPDIKILAQRFISETFLGKSFLSVHWRYDTQDWQDMCKTMRPEPVRNINVPLCEIAKRMESNVSAFNSLVSKVLLHAKEKGIDILYFAAPPQFLKVLQQAKSTWSSLYMISDVEAYAGRNKLYEDMFENNFRISFLEQELCYLSEYFLGSPLSSWTQSVLVDRTSEGRFRHSSVLDLLTGDEDKQFPKLSWYFPEGD